MQAPQNPPRTGRGRDAIFGLGSLAVFVAADLLDCRASSRSFFGRPEVYRHEILLLRFALHAEFVPHVGGAGERPAGDGDLLLLGNFHERARIIGPFTFGFLQGQ